MENENSKVGIVLLSVALTALVMSGSFFFIQQKNSISELKEEIGNLKKEALKKPAVEPATNEVKTENAGIDEKTPAPATPATENNLSLARDVEWLTYSDNDISFIYPKTFLGTSLQENFDKNMRDNEWKVFREGDILYIRPNFESPAAEFGATYEIKILKDTWAAEKEWEGAATLHAGPETTWGEKVTTSAPNYYVGVLRNLDFGMGLMADVYALVPGGIDGTSQSNKPMEKHFIIRAEPNEYQYYIENILIPSIQAK